ncbi:uncharacterized protein LOC117580532 [Drosophila guanche]|uniref:MARVEL domain-containing protein n=1 Tax=Drosophila guanche TaxID=7266 RepID=A0A3B0JVC7_DROGU|nr:uncharacterized protein LOC117580532 [Drosophila guanche]SPP76691.1 Hypothetical predicted protein [Drosophila guanche]
MLQPETTLLLGAYVIAIFDLLCASLFTGLCLNTIFEHLSWLSMFAVVFGIFWVSMIFVLFLGIYARNPRCLRAWILFSMGGILLEMCLLLYAVFRQSKFQIGLVRNGLFLVASLIVELIFLYTVCQFYKALARCKVCQRSLEIKGKPR